MAIDTPDWFASVPDLSSVWPELVSGRARVIGSGATEAHHYVQLGASPVALDTNKLSARRVKMFERVLLGEPLKVVAIEMGYSISTVATAVGDCLSAMGLTGGSNRIPALLVLALHALRGRAGCTGVRVELVSEESRDVQLSSDRLELPLRDKLTISELAVVALVIEGNSHAEIAKRRHTSARTVANQIASVHRKLRVSSRMELLCYLVTKLESDALRATSAGASTPIN
jgi:DNA-binding NarL/FixJ family response regulator